MKLGVTDIRTVGEEELLVTWSDEHRSLFNNRYLRLYCPCAHCVDEWTGKRVVDESKLTQKIGMRNFSKVGLYGIKFEWSDAHSTGIYSYEYLRRLCPCAICQRDSAVQEQAS